MYNCVWYFCIYLYGLSHNGWHAWFCITNNCHDVTTTTHAVMRHFLVWMTMARQPTKCRCSCSFTLRCTFICVYWWTRQRIHNTLIVVDRYLRLMGDYKNPLHLDVVDRYLRRMGDKTIPDSAEPRLESFYPPWVAGIDLPQSRCCGFFVSFTNKHKLRCILRLNTGTWAFRTLSHRRHPNEEVAFNCMRRYGDAETVICGAK